MVWLHSLLFAFSTLALTYTADPPDVVEIPLPAPAKWSEFKTSPGKIIKLSVPGATKWILIDDTSAMVIPDPDNKAAAFAAEKAGRYKMVVLRGEAEPNRIVMVVGTAPTPPEKDPLLDPVTGAYGGDSSATKAADKLALSAVYRVCAEAVKSPDVKTAINLFTVINSATETRIAGRLKPVRQLFGAELGKVMPTTPTDPLTQAQRDAAADALVRFAGILDAVK